MVARRLGAATRFPGKIFHRQTGTGEQCSPLQEFFDKLSESNFIHFFGFTTPELISSDSLWRSSCVFCTISQNWSNHKYTSFPCYIVIPYNPLEYTFRGRKKSPENLTDLVRPSGLLYIISVLSGRKGTLSPQILM